MTKKIDNRKSRLIKKILELKDDAKLSLLEEELKDVELSDEFWEAVKPIKENITFEDMIKEQNYKPINKEEFLKKVRALNIEEPIEELLDMLSK